MITNKQGVGVIALNSAGEIMMAKRYKSHGHNTWACSGGHIDDGETPLETAARELMEEAGIKLYHAKLVAIKKHYFPDAGTYTSHYIIGCVGNQTPQTLEAEKFGPWCFFNNWQSVPDTLFVDYANDVPMSMINDYWAQHKDLLLSYDI